WSVAAVLMIALWLRSYWRIDWISRLSSKSYANVASVRGRIGFWYDSPPPAAISLLLAKGWQFNVSPAPSGLPIWSRFDWRPSVNVVWVPHWVIIPCCAGLVVAPWVRWSKRFSIRTLLIATAVTAVFLGLVVWSNR